MEINWQAGNALALLTMLSKELGIDAQKIKEAIDEIVTTNQ